MNIVAGYGLDLIVVAIVVTLMVFHNKIKKITNSYFFWMGISVFLLIWYIVFRFAGYWGEYGQALHDGILRPQDYDNSFLISKALMLDICPLTGMLIPILLIADPTRIAARSISPICMVGAFFTLFCKMPFLENTEFTAQFIFIGDNTWRLYFFMHAMNFMLAIGVLINTPRFGLKGTLMHYGITLALFLYIVICAYSTGCRWNCSGMVSNDFKYELEFPGDHLGEYNIVGLAFHTIFRINWRFAPIIYLPIGAILLFCFLHLNDYVFKRFKHFKYPDKYSGCWYNWYKISKSKKL